MKISFLPLLGAATILTFAACGSNATEAGEAQESAQASSVASTFTVKEGSKVQFHGYKIVGTAEHTGEFNVTKGSLSIENGELVAGSFTLDMTNINILDEKADEYEQKLLGHFASDDFFHVEEFPTSEFEITKVVAKAEGDFTHEISGNLTIRDSVKNITFPANASILEEGVIATGKTTINRLDWGINYDKEKMSLSDKLKAKAKNGLVSEDVDIEFNISAGVATEETAEETTKKGASEE
jgi:polyisoprenoid-binding protein YceI